MTPMDIIKNLQMWSIIDCLAIDYTWSTYCLWLDLGQLRLCVVLSGSISWLESEPGHLLLRL